MATFKKIASTTLFAAGLGAAVLGLGSGIASASPAHDPGMIPLDHGWGGGGGDWDDHHGWRGRGWVGGPGWNGPGPGVYITPPCVSGPLGYVTVCA
ncbi:hypothetical protein FZI85_25835 [Mycobacterium sp. CBMA293]|uniref:hypothetical protein n=2 Tax=Mycolicibacterium TaxID=1866885 RepID=UPI0012DC512C|nr:MULTISPECIES: hypothetical protein [unclassified Mycolicibacterium]MUL47736.1 hypothetical protein [Mycolicibacterium sp. CBMA 360]MUL61746.1 hypothetical protein [Mycolicibacterium sp. CBMA 335]MUL70810.1 hypothetical protein [Mycolicibacterium sp. CBMA 311]MUL92964.1 hypothetical protein [Mycolicibacterium sp. CBMA 230]MUM08594.1 hypothetical protein [Mycolicibacterium sp. CBMA 213]